MIENMTALQQPTLPTMTGVTISDASLSIEYPMWEMMDYRGDGIIRGHTGERIFGFVATYSCPQKLFVEFEEFLLKYMERGIVREISKQFQSGDTVIYKIKGRVSDYVVRNTEKQASRSSVRIGAGLAG